jgi:hypothetical protein
MSEVDKNACCPIPVAHRLVCSREVNIDTGLLRQRSRIGIDQMAAPTNTAQLIQLYTVRIHKQALSVSGSIENCRSIIVCVVVS